MGIIGELIRQASSLSDNTNKVKGEQSDTKEGVVSDLLSELELPMPDDELLDLTKEWESSWQKSDIAKSIEKVWKDNENYWKGQQYSDISVEDHPLVDNIIFQAFEEFLAQATKENPEPTVQADNTDEGNELAGTTQKMLMYLADLNALKQQLKKQTRHWGLYHLGVYKPGWSAINAEITGSVVSVKKLAFDPDGTWDERGFFTGQWIREMRRDTAANLIRRFPKKKKYITDQAQKKLGTYLNYKEYWTDEYTCFKLGDGKDAILGKTKNPHFNYDPQQQMITDDYGQQHPIQLPPRNHFPVPKMPYIGLSIFNLGDQPFDKTGLIQQNVALQDLINKRLRQIDLNADTMNNGAVFSSDNFTKEQASNAVRALRDGGAVLVPGDVNRAYKRDQSQPLPSDIFNQLADARNELKNIFGTRGLSPAGLSQEQTVRGKILVSQSDASRIGGGISEAIEQVADTIFNYWVQMMYVYYDTPHTGSVVGQAKAVEYVQLSSSQMTPKLTVSVKEGSSLPKDQLTQANQAIDLWGAKALDPITLFEKLDFPNPKETAKNLLLWMTNPVALIPEAAPQMPAPAPPGQPGQAQGSPQPPMQNGADQAAMQQTPSLSQVPINQLNNSLPQ